MYVHNILGETTVVKKKTIEVETLPTIGTILIRKKEQIT